MPYKRSLEHFQKGVIVSNNALIMLHKYVCEKYNMKYICTSRLNQDVLENFFGAMRSKGGLNDHPSPKDLKYRLRKYVLARNTEQLSGMGNVCLDGTEWLNASEAIENLVDQPESESLDNLIVPNYDDIDNLKEDALEYISGYIIRKLNLEEYECHEISYTWVDEVSKWFLKKPSTCFLEKIK